MKTLEPIIIDPKTFLKKHCELPSLPEAVLRIQQIIHSDDVDIPALVKTVSSDPSLVAQILKIVNSAYYSLPREISEIKFAIAYLGLNEVYRLALTISVVRTITVANEKDLKTFWFHSYYTALVTKYLAKKFEPLLSMEELWPSAILHDIGKLIYLKFFPNHYAIIKEHSRKNECLFNESERELEFPSSGYLGALLCDHWRLPERIKHVCEMHNLDDLKNMTAGGEKNSFIKIITIANLMVVLSTNTLSTEKKEEILQILGTALEINEDEFLIVMGEVYELKIEVENFEF